MLSVQPTADILGLFQAEAGEHLQLISHELLQVERDPSARQDSVRKILRAAHSLKGTAAAAGLTSVEHLAHNWESCMQVLADGRLELTPAVVDLLYRLLDAIEVEIVRACSGPDEVGVVAVPSAAELRACFGDDLQLHEPEAEPVLAQAQRAQQKTRGDEGGLLRVATGKVDRLMANVDELVQVKASGASLVGELGRLSSLVQTLARELARAAQARKREPLRGAVVGQRDVGTLQEAVRSADQSAEICGQLDLALRAHTYRLNVLASRLQDDIRAVRMVPAPAVFGPFSRMVRDLGRRLDKQVVLRMHGADTEVDRDLLETLREPVMHLLRNAVAHGIEPAAQRMAAGKPVEGTITLSIASHAAGLEVAVHDDGQGIDLERVRVQLVARGALSERDAAQLDGSELERFLFQAGFSTASSIDAVSGRGVGLDVVRDVVERSGGSVRLEHVKGQGTRFVLRMPPSLTTMRVLIVRVAGSPVALPVSAIGRIVRVDREAVRQVNSGPAIEIDGRAVPLARLATLLELGGSATALDRVPAVVVGSAAEQCTLTVDAIDGERELVVAGLGDYLRHNPSIAGASVLSGGEIVPVVNVASLVRRIASKPLAARVFEPRSDRKVERKRVLIADDSITTRTLEKSILEAVGYEVEVATDGQDALQKLRARRFDLVLSDVQMPRMDGIELVTRVRADAELRRLKLVLVSSLAADDDRKRGLTAGADAYIGKNEFRQDLLLQTLERLLG